VKHGFAAIGATGRGGSIVNVSSLMGQVGYPGAVAYCATKGAITGMTKAAAMEGALMQPQVRVNSLHPGVIWTEMVTSQFGDSQELQDAFAAETPLKMIGLPEYVADAIVFLVCDDSSYMTGAELTVDGGRGAD
jgi:NAD(P)-dependent dehydrogenase (short-subunit alcohol dehydrogenase family)